MPERMVLSTTPWSELPDDERSRLLGYDNPELDVSLHRYVSEHVTIRGVPQQFNVLHVKGGPGPTTLMSTSYNYRLDDPLMRMKAMTIATQTNGSVAVSEVPGITKGHVEGHELETPGGHLSPQQLKHVVEGNFLLMGAEQMRAFDSVLHFNDGDEVRFWDESLGAYMSIARLQALSRGMLGKRVHVSRSDIIEPVNAHGDRSLAKQLGLIRLLWGPETNLRDVYLDENKRLGINVDAYDRMSPEHMRIDKLLKAKQQVASLAIGLGLRIGMDRALQEVMQDSSEDGPRIREGEIMFGRGIHSTVSRREDVESAAQAVRDAHGSARTVEYINAEGRAGHHIMDNIPRLAGYTIRREERDELEELAA